eukprot:13830352-Alexandrium_andersonii.AAC.1
MIRAQRTLSFRLMLCSVMGKYVTCRVEFVKVRDDGQDARVLVAHECEVLVWCPVSAHGADVKG